MYGRLQWCPEYKALSTRIHVHVVFNRFHILFISFSYRCHVDRSFSLKTMSLCSTIFHFGDRFQKLSFSVEMIILLIIFM